MKPLSICIPTYNRADYLPVLLDSIFAQPEAAGIEIIISDNNSSDATAAVAAAYQNKYKNLRYFKNETNIGFDGNMLAAVSRAGGRYCWALGDDDALLPGSLAYALDNIKSGLTFYAVSADLCDGDLKYLQRGTYIKRAKDGEVFDISNKSGILAYLARVKANMGLLGYIGGTIFRKDLWDKVPGREAALGGGWVHVYMLWYFKNLGASFKFLERPLVKIRMHNDGIIKTNGLIARLITEFGGLYEVAKLVFADEDERRAFLAAVCRYVAPNSLPPLFALSGKDKENWPRLAELINLYPYDESFKKSLSSPWRFSPVYFLRKFLNIPACRHIKKPFKFAKDLLRG